MSKLIEFVESMGADADFRSAQFAATAIAASALPAELKDCLQAGDSEALKAMVGAAPAMNCILAPPKSPGRDEEEEEEIRSLAMLRNVVNG